MAKKKQDIAGLLRKIIIGKNTSSETVNELYNQLLGLCINFLKDKLKKDVENTAEDIRGEVITNILKSTDNDFWKETEAETEENNKKINSYIYVMIREAYRNIKDNVADGESDLLYKAAEKICKELTEEGFLKQMENGQFALVSFNNYIENYDGSMRKYYVNLRRGKEQLDHTQLKEFIKFLFEELENYCFTVSILTRLVSQNSNLGSFLETRVNRNEIIDPDKSNEKENSIILSTNDEKDSIIVNTIILKWINKFKRIYDEDERLENALILVFFWNDFTLVKTAEFLKEKKLADISKSTIKNRIDNSLLKIDFFNAKIEKEERKSYMQYFIQTLINEFIPEEFISDMEKIRMEGFKR